MVLLQESTDRGVDIGPVTYHVDRACTFEQLTKRWSIEHLVLVGFAGDAPIGRHVDKDWRTGFAQFCQFLRRKTHSPLLTCCRNRHRLQLSKKVQWRCRQQHKSHCEHAPRQSAIATTLE